MTMDDSGTVGQWILPVLVRRGHGFFADGMNEHLLSALSNSTPGKCPSNHGR